MISNMAQIVVRIHSALRAIAGENETKVEARNVRQALDALAQKYGQEFKESLFDAHNQIDLQFYRIFLNKDVLTPEDGLRKELHDGDVLQIFPPVVGG
jgi:MoaD family protein